MLRIASAPVPRAHRRGHERASGTRRRAVRTMAAATVAETFAPANQAAAEEMNLPQARGAGTTQEAEARLLPWSPSQLAASGRGLGPAVPLYTPDFLSKEASKRPFAVVGRCLSIATTLGVVAGSVLIDAQTGAFERNSKQRARELREALTRLGPAFVKLGQARNHNFDLVALSFVASKHILQPSDNAF